MGRYITEISQVRLCLSLFFIRWLWSLRKPFCIQETHTSSEKFSISSMNMCLRRDISWSITISWILDCVIIWKRNPKFKKLYPDISRSFSDLSKISFKHLKSREEFFNNIVYDIFRSVSLNSRINQSILDPVEKFINYEEKRWVSWVNNFDTLLKKTIIFH